VIFLPSDYCPIKIVSWKVEPVIVNLNKQEERLSLIVTTNGSISAQDGLLEVANFLEQVMIETQQQFTTNKKIEVETS
jgi:DNA-directed RNA polymerase alpha subunit